MNQSIYVVWQIFPDRIKNIIRTVLGKDKIYIHPNAASNGSGMIKWALMIQRLSKVKIMNIFEIGANYGQDAEYMRYYLKLDPNNIYVFEPHPQLIQEVRKHYKFNSFDYAISNTNGSTIFHAIDLTKYNNSGISSLLKHKNVDEQNYYDVKVKLLRMDSFMQKYKIENIDFVKIDVEGCTYEVLEGFGEKLKYVKSIQLESEHVKLFEGQKLFDDVSDLLYKNDFKMVYFELLDGKQSDSLWIQKNILIS